MFGGRDVKRRLLISAVRLQHRLELVSDRFPAIPVVRAKFSERQYPARFGHLLRSAANSPVVTHSARRDCQLSPDVYLFPSLAPMISAASRSGSSAKCA